MALAGKPPTYEQYVALYWLRRRPYFRGMAMVAGGVGAAQSHGDLPLDLFDAITDSSKAAEDLQFQVNADRLLARSKARRGA